MKRIILLVGLLWTATASAQWLEYIVGEAIPDNDEFGLQNTQVVSGFSDVITSVQVMLRLDALPSDLACNGDFYVTLQHSSGFAVLLNRVGVTSSDPLGYADNGFDVVFAAGEDEIHTYQEFTYSLDLNGALTGTWDADARNVDPDLVLDTSPRTAGLDAFNGLDPNGNGVLHSWGLQIEVIPEPAILCLLLMGLGLVLRGRRQA